MKKNNLMDIKYDTTKEWTKNNPVLNKGVLGIELCATGITKMKVGDGKHKWIDLKYLTIDKGDFAKLFNLFLSANNVRLKLKMDNTMTWEIEDPVLLHGEPGFEKTEFGINLKVGDGHSKWTELPYVIDNSTDKTIEDKYIKDHKQTKKVLIGSVVLNVLMAICTAVSILT